MKTHGSDSGHKCMVVSGWEIT